ncbi:MAG: efflux RND transporter periplasmic adaptor subunit [Bacteroidales bacterium]|jgi:HlyD family secretion protein|nr:efflux RND transporter periplasmic adaptor subunit [Bacteroidales bacterium]
MKILYTMKHLLLYTALIALTVSCSNSSINFDASGSFEAEEIIISAETTGILEEFSINEGDVIQKGQKIGCVDSTQIYLKKKQLEAQIDAVLSRKPEVAKQIAGLQEQLKAANIEYNRISKLVESDAATKKQLDDIVAQISILEKQIVAQKSSLHISTNGIQKESIPIVYQIAQLNDQLSKCILTAPISGTILTKFAYAHEMTATGKALYKIADLSTIILRAYISGDQLSQIKLGQKVWVYTDSENGDMQKTEGTITWISDKAEFTPKTVQTKNERANLVYAIKVSVVNNGLYKIGMYGEITFE